MCAYPVFHVGSRSHSHVLVLGQQPLSWRNYQPCELEECLWSSRNSGFWVLGLWSEVIRVGEGRVGKSTAHELWWADSYWYLIEKVIISLNLPHPCTSLSLCLCKNKMSRFSCSQGLWTECFQVIGLLFKNTITALKIAETDKTLFKTKQ